MKKILLALFTILLIGSFTSFGQLTKSLAVFGSSTAACFPTDPISYNGCWLGDLRDIYNKPGVTQINPLSVYALNTATLFNALPMS